MATKKTAVRKTKKVDEFEKWWDENIVANSFEGANVDWLVGRAAEFRSGALYSEIKSEGALDGCTSAKEACRIAWNYKRTNS